MSKREIALYQRGLLDAVEGVPHKDKPSLSHALGMAGETDLLLAYVEGWVVGKRLMEGKTV